MNFENTEHILRMRAAASVAVVEVFVRAALPCVFTAGPIAKTGAWR
jgi:hypothetical protein